MRKKEKYEEIEYIIPKNYDIKPKILGVIEQEALVLFIKYMVIYIIKEKVYLYEKQIIN